MENNKDNEQSTSDAVGLPHQQFDIVAKEPFYVFPEDMLRFLMNRLDFEFIEHVDSKLTTVEVRHMDVLIKVRLDGAPVLIRLDEIDGASILEAAQPGLMPFTPLMKPPAGMSKVEWTGRCVEVTQSLPLDPARRNNLLVELWVMSGLAHDRQSLLSLIPEDIMNESSVYQMIIERGMERGKELGIEEGKELGIEEGKKLGAKAFAVERIRDLLNRRFNIQIAADALTPFLEKVEDLQQFSRLMDAAAEAEHLENFMQTLASFQNDA